MMTLVLVCILTEVQILLSLNSIFKKSKCSYFPFEITILIFWTINFYFSWNYFGLFIILNYATLFYLLDLQNKNLNKIFIVLLYNLIFNLSVIYWLLEINKLTGFFSILTNSIILTISFFPILITSNKYYLIFCYVAFEYLSTFWFISFPWLNLGNIFGNSTYLIQWYYFTSVYGGSLWILLLSYFLFKSIKKRNYIYIFFGVLSIPILISLLILKNISNQNYELKYKVLVINKNNTNLSNYNKIKEIITFVEKNKIDYVITPEVYFNDFMIDDLESGSLNVFYNRLKNNETLFIFGADLIENKKYYNSVIIIGNKQITTQIKSKLVPVNEYINPNFTKILGKSKYNKKKSVEIKKNLKNLNILICYESVFSFYKKRNKLNFIITSETFIKDIQIAKLQYLNICKIRAIENKTQFIKCSNDGINAIIDERGFIKLKNIENFSIVNYPI